MCHATAGQGGPSPHRSCSSWTVWSTTGMQQWSVEWPGGWMDGQMSGWMNQLGKQLWRQPLRSAFDFAQKHPYTHYLPCILHGSMDIKNRKKLYQTKVPQNASSETLYDVSQSLEKISHMQNSIRGKAGKSWRIYFQLSVLTWKYS